MAIFEFSDEVADALAAGLPVVALESTIVAHGLPRPDNLRVAREIEDAVRAGGAQPATRLGLSLKELMAAERHDEELK